MRRYLLSRLFLAVPTVFGVVTLVFLLIHLVPGDPVDVMLGETARAADKVRLRHQLGLDRPLPIQYARYLRRLARADLGRSLHSGRPVRRMIVARYPATLELAAGALFFAVLLAAPLGIAAAARPNSLLDALCRGGALVGAALPNFWLGPLLILMFAIAVEWAPVSGRDGLAHLVLPALTLGMGMAAVLIRMLRATLLERLGDDYIRTARAKGASEPRVVLTHALRNAVLPVVTVLGLQAGGLLAGAIITETVFAWPGIGRLTLLAIQTRDYPLVQGCMLVIALTYVLINLCTDLLYGAIDPRLRTRQ
ncbi:MAG TPA: nickel ABC transporter permease [Candidatus Margulisiibacteriota bacterium]|nr:nickel ABC transporter permease [Candidatus Margulisiibacteriota bacterium]